MGRRPKPRVIGFLPLFTCFVPSTGLGRPTPSDGKTIALGLDELEALRLSHLENLDQALAAKALGVSRPTFGRILGAAHKKLARALVEGAAIVIRGGEVIVDPRPRICKACGRVLPPDGRQDDPMKCPVCSGTTRNLEPEDLEDVDQTALDRLDPGLTHAEKLDYLRTALSLSGSPRHSARRPGGGPRPGRGEG